MSFTAKVANSRHILAYTVDINPFPNFYGCSYTTEQFSFAVMEYPYDTVILYAYGNMKLLKDSINYLKSRCKCTLYVIGIESSERLSYSEECLTDYTLVDIGQVPENIHNVGVFFPILLFYSYDFYERITTAHEFQA